MHIEREGGAVLWVVEIPTVRQNALHQHGVFQGVSGVVQRHLEIELAQMEQPDNEDETNRRGQHVERRGAQAGKQAVEKGLAFHRVSLRASTGLASQVSPL